MTKYNKNISIKLTYTKTILKFTLVIVICKILKYYHPKKPWQSVNVMREWDLGSDCLDLKNNFPETYQKKLFL